ncbi:hypothetical protein T03_7993, partial [Trichinella britovi]
MYGGSSMTRTSDKHYHILTDTRRSVVAGGDVTSAGFWTSGNQFLCHIYHSINSYFTYYVSLLTQNRWKQRITNYKWCPVREQHPTTLGDDVNDYEVLKADLKKIRSSEVGVEIRDVTSRSSVVATWRTSRRFCYQSPRGGRVDLNDGTVNHSTDDRAGERDETMDEARRITLKTVLIEEASYSMDFRNNYPYDRRMEELTAALNCSLNLTGDSCVEGATKPSLSEDTYQRKHQATIEARLEKLEECCMRPLGNQTTRERLQPLRFLDGSSRKADDPLALATKVVIDDTPITQLKIQGFSIQFLLDSEAAVSTISKELDINDQDDIGLTNLLMTYDDRQEGRDINSREAVSVPVVFATNCTDETREKIAGLLRQNVETTSMSDGDLGRSSVIKHRLRKFVE